MTYSELKQKRKNGELPGDGPFAFVIIPDAGESFKWISGDQLDKLISYDSLHQKRLMFGNGTKVQYAGGLEFTFIGMDPNNSGYAYLLHPSAKDESGQPRVDRLQVERLTISCVLP